MIGTECTFFSEMLINIPALLKRHDVSAAAKHVCKPFGTEALSGPIIARLMTEVPDDPLIDQLATQSYSAFVCANFSWLLLRNWALARDLARADFKIKGDLALARRIKCYFNWHNFTVDPFVQWIVFGERNIRPFMSHFLEAHAAGRLFREEYKTAARSMVWTTNFTCAVRTIRHENPSILWPLCTLLPHWATCNNVPDYVFAEERTNKKAFEYSMELAEIKDQLEKDKNEVAGQLSRVLVPAMAKRIVSFTLR
jgi:hypothetical protein